MQTPGEEQGVGAYSLFNFGSQRPSPYKVQLSVTGQPLEMDVDTGAPCLWLARNYTTTFSQQVKQPNL